MPPVSAASAALKTEKPKIQPPVHDRYDTHMAHLGLYSFGTNPSVHNELSVRRFVMGGDSKSEMEIGRSSQTSDKLYQAACENALFDCRVMSRPHALLSMDAKRKKLYIEDSKSMHGTYLHDQRINGRAEVKNGDFLRFGATVVRGTGRFSTERIESYPDRTDIIWTAGTETYKPLQVLVDIDWEAVSTRQGSDPTINDIKSSSKEKEGDTVIFTGVKRKPLATAIEIVDDSSDEEPQEVLRDPNTPYEMEPKPSSRTSPSNPHQQSIDKFFEGEIILSDDESVNDNDSDSGMSMDPRSEEEQSDDSIQVEVEASLDAPISIYNSSDDGDNESNASEEADENLLRGPDYVVNKVSDHSSRCEDDLEDCNETHSDNKAPSDTSDEDSEEESDEEANADMPDHPDDVVDKESSDTIQDETSGEVEKQQADITPIVSDKVPASDATSKSSSGPETSPDSGISDIASPIASFTQARLPSPSDAAMPKAGPGLDYSSVVDNSKMIEAPFLSSTHPRPPPLQVSPLFPKIHPWQQDSYPQTTRSDPAYGVVGLDSMPNSYSSGYPSLQTYRPLGYTGNGLSKYPLGHRHGRQPMASRMRPPVPAQPAACPISETGAKTGAQPPAKKMSIQDLVEQHVAESSKASQPPISYNPAAPLPGSPGPQKRKVIDISAMLASDESAEPMKPVESEPSAANQAAQDEVLPKCGLSSGGRLPEGAVKTTALDPKEHTYTPPGPGMDLSLTSGDYCSTLEKRREIEHIYNTTNETVVDAIMKEPVLRGLTISRYHKPDGPLPPFEPRVSLRPDPNFIAPTAEELAASRRRQDDYKKAVEAANERVRAAVQAAEPQTEAMAEVVVDDLNDLIAEKRQTLASALQAKDEQPASTSTKRSEPDSEDSASEELDFDRRESKRICRSRPDTVTVVETAAPRGVHMTPGRYVAHALGWMAVGGAGLLATLVALPEHMFE